MSNALKHQEVVRFKQMLADDNRYLLDELRSVSGDEIIGADLGLSMVMRMVEQVSLPRQSRAACSERQVRERSSSPMQSTALPARKDGPFIKVNCGAIPESLLDSELFGHEKVLSPAP